MKNIHIIPTDRPSRLFKDDNQVLNLYTHSILKGIFTNGIGSNQYIYITSDEEIKVGDWVIEFQKGDNIGEVHFINGKYVIANDIQKKIILTTDQDLINDGVQAIDDEFLEWFVNNPSCEEVKVVEKQHFEADKSKRKNTLNGVYYSYKTIIPKEEPKQVCENCKKEISEWGCACGKQVKPKQETLEEAAEIWINNRFTKQICGDKSYPDIYASKKSIIESHIIFAKSQGKIMYSEEDMLNFAWFLKENLGQYSCDRKAHFEGKYFEQFKKK